MSNLFCGPKVNGVRLEGNRSCNFKCKYYALCCKEIGNAPRMKFVESDPTEKELTYGIGHLAGGQIKVWRMVPIKE